MSNDTPQPSTTAVGAAIPWHLYPPEEISAHLLFERRKTEARTYAASALIPEHLRGKPADVMIAMEMARLLGEAPLIVMQAIHVVSGKAGFSAQYMIARANRSGLLDKRITWTEAGSGDSFAVTAHAVLDGQPIAFTASMAMAKGEGWAKNPKYQSMPQLMLRYRSAAFLIRLHLPEVMLGYQTVEEIEDTTAAPAAKRPQVMAWEDEAPAIAADVIDAEPEPAKPGPVAAAVLDAEPQPKRRKAAPVADDDGMPS